jgi:hypothetical protein
MKYRLTVAILVLAAMPARAHRLDEYLQGTIVSVEKNRLHAEMLLTPGVAVFPFVMAGIDTNGDGVISADEQRAYAARVLSDLSFTIDGHRLTLSVISMQFSSVDDMKEGRGGIQFDFDAELPRGGRNRRLTIENRHLSRIAAYQVNCLVPQDPDLRVASQVRNYSQSIYELDYQDSSVPVAPSFRWWYASPLALLLCFRLPLFWRQRAATSSPARGW